MRKAQVLLGVVLALVTAWVGTGVSFADSHQDEQIKRIAEFRALLASGKKAEAATLADAALARAARAGPNDPARADALELRRELLLANEDYKNAAIVSAEVVRMRIAGSATEPLLAAFALQFHAIALYGGGQAGEADLALVDSIEYFRKGYGPNDRRLAGMLETFVKSMLSTDGYDRPLLAVQLMREAVEVRDRVPDSGPQAMASSLQDLAMLEMRTGHLDDADRHLTRAVELLETAIKMEPSPERKRVMRGGISDMLILRARLASKGGRLREAKLLKEKSAALVVKGSPDADANRLLAAVVDSQIAEQLGDIDAALDHALAALDFAEQAKDRLTVLDMVETIGALELRKGDLDLAQKYLELALNGRGGPGPPTSETLLRLAKIAEQKGDAAKADDLYRQGFKHRQATTSEMEVFFGTNRRRSGAAFNADRAAAVTLGKALVLVPGGPGSDYAVLKTGATKAIAVADPTAIARLLTLKAQPLDAGPFESDVQRKTAAARLYPNTALVFVHGFGTTLDFALARTGQLTRDINFDGPAFAFCWPSRGNFSLSAYTSDEAAAKGSIESFLQFLETVASATKAERILLISHSMGGRILLQALANMKAQGGDGLLQKVKEIVFASPDIDQKQFKSDVRALGRSNITLYASSHDAALTLSWFKNLFSKRAGHVWRGILASGGPVIAEGVESIDISEAGDDVFAANHDVYATNPLVTEDLRKLLEKSLHPPTARSPRFLQERKGERGAPYWYFSLKEAAR